MKQTAIERSKVNAEEDYLRVPISVLRYISDLEQLQAKHEEELKELKSLLEESRSIYKEDSRADQEWEARLCKIM